MLQPNGTTMVTTFVNGPRPVVPGYMTLHEPPRESDCSHFYQRPCPEPSSTVCRRTESQVITRSVCEILANPEVTLGGLNG